jgi:hypothetical protein
MANLPTTFFSNMVSGPANELPLLSVRAKGCGYNGQTNGIHTIQYIVSNSMVGIIKIQGTLATSPIEDDWADAAAEFGDGVNVTPDQNITVSFGGNYVWIRAVIAEFTAGSINRVLYNHN